MPSDNVAEDSEPARHQTANREEPAGHRSPSFFSWPFASDGDKPPGDNSEEADAETGPSFFSRLFSKSKPAAGSLPNVADGTDSEAARGQTDAARPALKVVRISNFVEERLRPHDAKLVDSGAKTMPTTAAPSWDVDETCAWLSQAGFPQYTPCARASV